MPDHLASISTVRIRRGLPPRRKHRDVEAAGYSDSTSTCPSSVSPPAFHRGSDTDYLTSDVPETTVSQWANVSSDVL